MTLVIREFEPRDIEFLQAIRARAFAPVFKSFRALLGDEIAAVALATAEGEQEQLLNGLCTNADGHHVMVALMDDRAVGFAAVTLDHQSKTGELKLIAVDPEFASRGIGSRLCDRAVSQMRSSGMKVACVGTGADRSHAPARRTYEKAGFEKMLPNQWMYRML